MRQIGSISNLDQAERFADHLRADGIGCSIDKDSDSFRIWIHDDDRVPASKEELSRFLGEPKHERYRDAARRAMARLREDRDRLKAVRGQTVNLSEKWSRPTGAKCPITFGLIAISVFVALFAGFPPQHNDPLVNRLWFSIDGTFQPIRNGEIWRIVTPIFLHGNLVHLVFNLLMAYQFGLEIESRRGSPKFLGMILIIAALSNTAQFWFNGQRIEGQWLGNPSFLGMSGVVYGLFGYMWVKGKLDPNSGFDLPQQTVMMMMVWYVLCVVGVIPQVANWCHGVGLATGIALAVGGSLIQPFLRRT